MEWSKQTTLKLIDLYRDKPVLWNQTHRDYKNKRKRFDAWTDISNELNIDKGELEKKIKNVNSQFLRELKRLKETKTSPDASHWFAFDRLLFLRDKTKLTSSRDNADSECTLHESNETAQSNNSTVTKNEPHKHQTNSLANILKASQSRRDAKQNDFDFPFPEKKSADLSKNVIKWPDEKPSEAYNVRTEENHNHGRDEWNIFGELVGHKLRALPTHHARATVQHLINNIMWEADMGKYNFPPDPSPFSLSSAPGGCGENQHDKDSHCNERMNSPSKDND